MNSSHVFRNILAAGVAVIAVSTPAHAQDRAFSVPAGDLKTALDSFSRQAGIQIIYKPDEVSGARTRGIRGVVAADAALDRILAGSGFVAERDPSGAIAITRATETQATGAVAEDVEDAAIVVTASRVERAGFVGDDHLVGAAGHVGDGDGGAGDRRALVIDGDAAHGGRGLLGVDSRRGERERQRTERRSRGELASERHGTPSGWPPLRVGAANLPRTALSMQNVTLFVTVC